MGKKYIIELEDKPFHKEDGDFLYRVKGFNSLVFDMTGINKLTPYTEPNFERVRKEAYSNGYDDGYNGGRDTGLADAWEAARKICGSVTAGGLNYNTLDAIFGSRYLEHIVDTFTAAEAIEKLKAYEQKREEIKVGDEVVSEDDIKAVVIDMDDYLLHVLDENGLIQGWPREDVAKTDRHFPDIAEVLEKMRGENND